MFIKVKYYLVASKSYKKMQPVYLNVFVRVILVLPLALLLQLLQSHLLLDHLVVDHVHLKCSRLIKPV